MPFFPDTFTDPAISYTAVPPPVSPSTPWSLVPPATTSIPSIEDRLLEVPVGVIPPRFQSASYHATDFPGFTRLQYSEWLREFQTVNFSDMLSDEEELKLIAPTSTLGARAFFDALHALVNDLPLPDPPAGVTLENFSTKALLSLHRRIQMYILFDYPWICWTYTDAFDAL